ncbi:peroxiredoxin-like family protein [Pleionea sediminis]|uniref:peroxiredoxin-like family protein n=1 Tax=Pleionea sediminis TaxID=2569479 RepID=UPI0013DE31F1|nr:peroxiredoxin-like family protein [Pleionea sediminis]
MKTNLLIVIALFLTTSVLADKRSRIADTPNDVAPLLVGQTIPDTPLWTSAGKPVSLTKLATKQPIVLVFYRGGWCPYCNHQLQEMKSIEGDLQNLGYQIIAVSPELPDTIKKMEQERDLGYLLLSDFRVEVSRDFGIAFRVENEITQLIKDRLGAELQRFEGEQQANLPVPAVFIVDKKGVIQFSYVNPNYQVRLHPELLLKAAEVALKGEEVRLKR